MTVACAEPIPETICRVVVSDTELQEFWAGCRSVHRFAATGNEIYAEAFMPEGTWIVGRTREAVVKAALGWDSNQIHCVWEAVEDGGWWKLHNLPNGHTEDSLFDGMLNILDDPAMDSAEVERQKQLQIFEHWAIDTSSPVQAYEKGSMNQLFMSQPEWQKDFACEMSEPFPPNRTKRQKRRKKR